MPRFLDLGVVKWLSATVASKAINIFALQIKVEDRFTVNMNQAGYLGILVALCRHRMVQIDFTSVLAELLLVPWLSPSQGADPCLPRHGAMDAASRSCAAAGASAAAGGKPLHTGAIGQGAGFTTILVA